MDWTHVHLLLNHFPTVGMIVGLGVFIAALLLRSDDLKRASLVVFFFIALLSIPTFVTGTAAELALAKNPEIAMGRVQAHETAAFEALWFVLLTGALSWLGLWQFRRLARIPQATLTSVLLIGLASFGMMAWASNLGGEIHHAEIRSGPAAADPPTDAGTGGEADSTKEPLARIIGDAMVNVTWTWAASETVHFIGLSLLFGVVLLVDLRMLGFVKGIPYKVLHRLLPWGVLGFGLNTVTGMLFFVGAPTSFYVTNGLFFWKLALILVAGANALYFTAFDQPWILGPSDTPPVAAKFAAATGIALWVGVLFCGQMLPFFGHSF